MQGKYFAFCLVGLLAPLLSELVIVINGGSSPSLDAYDPPTGFKSQRSNSIQHEFKVRSETRYGLQGGRHANYIECGKGKGAKVTTHIGSENFMASKGATL